MSDKPLSDDMVANITLNAIGEAMKRFKHQSEARSCVGFLLMTAYNLMRTMEDDDYMIGWLESAIKDVRQNKPAIAVVKPH